MIGISGEIEVINTPANSAYGGPETDEESDSIGLRHRRPVSSEIAALDGAVPIYSQADACETGTITVPGRRASGCNRRTQFGGFGVDFLLCRRQALRKRRVGLVLGKDVGG